MFQFVKVSLHSARGVGGAGGGLAEGQRGINGERVSTAVSQATHTPYTAHHLDVGLSGNQLFQAIPLLFICGHAPQARTEQRVYSFFFF